MSKELETFVASVRALVEKYPARKPMGDDDEPFNAYDASGGNFDDAYSIGYDHGEHNVVDQLRELLTALEAVKVTP